MSGYRQKVIQLWNDWQLSVAVLLSFGLQLLLLSTAHLRRRTRPRWWSKAYFWTLYIGCRFIAPYALGILSRASKGDANADIQAFWAALLLFHLGGVDDFTALSLEDNKLWVRRGFEMFMHVVTTGYVFVRYFPDPAFRRFVVPFALIYVAGVVKYVEQVITLQRATMKELIRSVLEIPDAGPDYEDFMDRVNGILRSGVLPFLNPGRKGVDQPSTSAAVQIDPADQMRQVQTPEEAAEIVASAFSLFQMFKVLFADGIFSYKERRDGQAKFLDPNASWRAFRIIDIELSFVYDQLYTRAPVSHTRVGLLVRVGSLLLTLTSVLFALITTADAHQYKWKHRCVTYTLLSGAVVTDIVILVARVLDIRSLLSRKWLRRCSVWLVNRGRWSGYMAQSNLITFCLQNLPSESELAAFIISQLQRRRLGINRGWFVGAWAPPTVALVGELRNAIVQELEVSDSFQKYFEKRSLFKQIRSKSFWKNFKQTKHVHVRGDLQDFIFRQLKKKESQLNDWEGERRRRTKTLRSPGGNSSPNERHRTEETGRTPEIRDPVTGRGDQVLEDEKITGLEWSIQEKEFDESLLIWHIATDLCLRQEDGSHQAMQTRKHMDMARELSNYLFYIMVVHPLMLPSSTTMAIKRCRDTCAEARRHFLKRHIESKTRRHDDHANAEEMAVSEESAHVFLLKVVEVTSLEASVVKGDKSKSVLWDGCFLANELGRIMGGDPNKKWQVICKVWVEMLCHAAVHCRGYEHAERLKEGGELITFVSLLMTHLGMGKHYRTEVGDAYPHLSPYVA